MTDSDIESNSSDVGLHYNIEAALWKGGYVTRGEEEECQAFGDDLTAKGIDLDVLLADIYLLGLL